MPCALHVVPSVAYAGVMRLALLAVILSCTCGLAAESKPSPGPDEPEPTPLRTIFVPEAQFDLGFRTGRTSRGHWINCAGLHGLFRLHVVNHDARSWVFGMQAGFEQWFGLEPAPRRYSVGTRAEFVVRGGLDGGYWNPPVAGQPTSPPRYGTFPMNRGSMFDLGATLTLDFTRTEALGEHVSSRTDRAMLHGLRAGLELPLGIVFLRFEPGVAATWNFGTSGPLDVEAWAKLGVGRPISPFSGHVGYIYHSTGRFGVHYLTVGLRALF